jgi:transposase
MARTRLSMRKIREVLRLKASGLSYRAIARVCLIGKETVREYLGRAAEAGLTWPLPERRKLQRGIRQRERGRTFS